MTRLTRTLLLAATTAALLTAGCSPDSNQASDPGAKKVISACQSVSGDEATIIFSRGTLIANRMAGEGQIRSVCAYKNDKNETVALIQLQPLDPVKDKDTAALLAADAKRTADLFAGNVKPPKFHPADGFVPGSYYGDVTPRFNAYEVEMGTIEGAFKLTVVVNDPKDFATGETQLAAVAHKVYENIQNGNAFTTL